MKLRSKHALAVLLASVPASVFATNGMMMIGFGAKSEAVGGAAIAFPQDAMAGASNPATISWIDVSTMRIDVGAELFLPDAEVSLDKGTSGTGVSGPAITQKSRANTFVIPNMGGAMKFNRKITIGMTAVGAGGGGSRYNKNLYNVLAEKGSPDETLGVSLFIMQVNPTVSFKLNSQNSFGGSLILGLQQFRAFGMGTNFGSKSLCGSDGCMSNQGNDYSTGAGLRLGWMGRFFDDRLSLGAAGSSRVYMQKIKKYEGLFPNAGEMDTPPMLGVGLALKLNDKMDVAFDVTHTYYKLVDAIGNPGPDPNSSDLVIPGESFGDPHGAGFGWNNQTVYKLGMAYKLNDDWTLRAGWNYGKSPIPEDRAILLNLVAPATTEHHLTLGGTRHLGPGPMGTDAELSFVYVHAFKFEQYGPTYLTNQDTGQTGFGKIGMSQNAFGVSIGLKL